MFDKVFISDPDFKYMQYLTLENLLLAFCFIFIVYLILFIIPDFFTEENL
ncbi:hypothetical protein [Acinetobacter faecalis]|nr:hypothetical protein [Acinetobacter faecalis]MDY6456013.1 hypothetical protein [Acinetobacter faecalis]